MQGEEMENVHQTTSSVPVTSRRQFTIAGMLSYTLAAALYCSTLASVRPLVDWDSRPRTVWLALTTVLTAWCVLWWLYRRWRLSQAIGVHCAGPAITLVFVAVWLLFTIPIGINSAIRSPPESCLAAVSDTCRGPFVVMICVYGVSTAVSLPVATVVLLCLMLSPVPERMTSGTHAKDSDHDAAPTRD
jgi:hypothetical protein